MLDISTPHIKSLSSPLIRGTSIPAFTGSVSCILLLLFSISFPAPPFSPFKDEASPIAEEMSVTAEPVFLPPSFAQPAKAAGSIRHNNAAIIPLLFFPMHTSIQTNYKLTTVIF